MDLLIICANPWCKGQFKVKEIEGEELPKVCPKCKSFDNELSGGVVWENKKYEGKRHDGQAHETKINIKRNF